MNLAFNEEIAMFLQQALLQFCLFCFFYLKTAKPSENLLTTVAACNDSYSIHFSTILML